MNNPLVTVVVPVYNVEKYLDRCIESIVNQTYKNLEIILVDDGSPDNCPKMCDDWAKKDSRIKVIHKKNAGLGMARNSGIEIAAGQYILFIDSDDYIKLETIAKCVSVFQEKQTDIVCFELCYAFEDGKIVKHPFKTDEFYFSGEKIVEDILPGLFTYERGVGLSACCKMYNFQMIKDNDLKFESEREILSEDAIFNLEVFQHVKSLYLIPETFYFYYKNEKSLTRSYKEKLQEVNNNFLKRCIMISAENGENNRLINSIRARYHIYAFTGMKQINVCDFTEKQKKILLYRMFNDETFRASIVFETFKPKSIPLKIFFMCIKLRLYWMCRILLKLAN